MAAKKKPATRKAAKKPAAKHPKKPTLKPRHQKFAEGVLKHGNGTQAAAEAGFQGGRDTLAVTASRLLRNAKVSAYLEERIAGLPASTDEVHSLLAQHLRGDVALFEECFKSDGDIDLVHAHQIGVSRLVKKLKRRRRPVIDSEGEVVGHEFVLELELYDAQSAAAKLADLMGLKQQPKANEHDAQVNRAMAERTLERLITDCNFEREDAVAFLRQNAPEVARWLM